MPSQTPATEDLQHFLQQAGKIILGKDHILRQALACLLARGHLLLEDVPGVGKTTLAQTLAHLLGLTYQRVQFTSDLLPADILGVSVFERSSERFSFRPGPIFTQVLLADELNRATPKTQSALLEAMEERQVTVDGITHQLAQPFFVIATQNPNDQAGTFPLPQSQLDRFFACLQLGYPDEAAEKELLTSPNRRLALQDLPRVLDVPRLVALQNSLSDIHASPTLINYVFALIDHTRRGKPHGSGLSPRAGLGLLQMARAWALLEGRTMILPEDVQAVLPSAINHRLRLAHAHTALSSDHDIATQIIRAVPVPL